jgi:hypothetical protein
VRREEGGREVLYTADACRTQTHACRERGDPRELLKSINPREAQLADAASGIHVRFRLGGTVFPPLVFYKIFTHIAVTGECRSLPP